MGAVGPAKEAGDQGSSQGTAAGTAKGWSIPWGSQRKPVTSPHPLLSRHFSVPHTSGFLGVPSIPILVSPIQTGSVWGGDSSFTCATGWGSVPSGEALAQQSLQNMLRQPRRSRGSLSPSCCPCPPGPPAAPRSCAHPVAGTEGSRTSFTGHGMNRNAWCRQMGVSSFGEEQAFPDPLSGGE